jgi:hypothetical protein
VIKAHKYSKSNKMENTILIQKELSESEKYKNKFEKLLIDEINLFVTNYSTYFVDLMEEFKMLLKSINSQVKLVNHNVMV